MDGELRSIMFALLDQSFSRLTRSDEQIIHASLTSVNKYRDM